MRQLLLFFSILSHVAASAQHQPGLDFIRAQASIAIDPLQESIRGEVTYEFEVLQDVDSVFLDARKMDFSLVRLNGKKIKYNNTGSQLSVVKNFRSGKEFRLKLQYTCTPKQTVYFSGWDDDIPNNEQVWTQGQGKYTSHWLPSFDAMEEKVEFDLDITFDASYEVIANGIVEIGPKKSGSVNPVNTHEKESLADADSVIPQRLKTWHFDMEHPMSSYLLAFAIGNYDLENLTSKSGIPIKNYYYAEDSLRVEPTYRYSQEIFDFLEDEIGVPYPWQNYKQVPVHDFLYAGMENTGTTIFSDGYVIDSTAFVDKNYVIVNAHELAHQWFGNLVTEKDAQHHWLHEGFATYYAYLAEKELFGDEHFYWKLYGTLMQLQDQVERGEGQSLLDPSASSLTFYEKGAWALFALREKIGDEAFRRGIQNYLRKYRFENVTVLDFLNEMANAYTNSLADSKENLKDASTKTSDNIKRIGKDSPDSDLAEFKSTWLGGESIPFEDAKRALAERSASLRLWFEMESDVKKNQGDAIDYAKYWNAHPSIHLKKNILENYMQKLPDSLIARAFASDTVPVRQALATSKNIERFPKEDFESLLNDKSYLTIENALYKLWEAYPTERSRYLEKTKNIIGFPNKNIRLLWLTLAISTEGYRGSETKEFFDELSGYTDPQYSFEVRQGAFFYLKEAFGFTDKNLKDLIRATNHHSWQFRQFARRILDDLLKDSEYRTRIQEASKELNKKDLRYLNSTENWKAQ